MCFRILLGVNLPKTDYLFSESRELRTVNKIISINLLCFLLGHVTLEIHEKYKENRAETVLKYAEHSSTVNVFVAQTMRPQASKSE